MNSVHRSSDREHAESTVCFVKKMHKHAVDLNRTHKIAYLLLEDGSVFPGRHFGAERPVDGEIGECTSNTCSSIASTHVHGCFHDIALSAVSFSVVYIYI